MVPASNDIVGAYGDYQAERCAIVGTDGNDMVLVNLYHPPLDAAMTSWGSAGR